MSSPSDHNPPTRDRVLDYLTGTPAFSTVCTLLEAGVLAHGVPGRTALGKGTAPEAAGASGGLPPVSKTHGLQATRGAPLRGEVSVGGLWGSAPAALMAALSRHLRRPILAVCPSLDEGDDLVDDLTVFADGDLAQFPAWDTVPERVEPGDEVQSDRQRLVERLARSGTAPAVIVAPVQALMQPVPSRESILASSRHLAVGDEQPPDQLAEWLVAAGFERESMVELAGQFAVRGGVFDVWPFALAQPLRLDFFGDRIERIRFFDPLTQRSSEAVDAVDLATPRLRGASPTDRDQVSLLSLLPHETIVAIVEPESCQERASSYVDRLRDPRGTFSFEGLWRASARFGRVLLNPLPGAGGTVNFMIGSVERFSGDVASVKRELGDLCQRHTAVVFCDNAAEAQRLRELFVDHPALQSGRLTTEVGALTRGFTLRDLDLVLLPNRELFHRYADRRVVKPRRRGRAIESFLELARGDYVVHVTHGIGRFVGMEVLAHPPLPLGERVGARGRVSGAGEAPTLTLPSPWKGEGAPETAAPAPVCEPLRGVEHEGTREECLVVEFADQVRVYVPATRIDLVQKYIGGFERYPRLSRVGTTAWENRKAVVKAAVTDLAADMLNLQARRASQPGIAYPDDTLWQREFEASFIYAETPDQLEGLAAIKQDQQRPRPMDRLLCGDVGYGKTELAMRAAFKVVEAGRQVAVLVPTTILAEQHGRTFKERMADYPVVVEVLSRFRTRGEQDRVLERLAEGAVDILIGTHRIIQDDVHFRDLGLIIIDEEQRFGVKHKERLKRFRETVDVLTLTATPIPRTLHMSLLGIRDISSLATPPADRLAIHTELVAWEPERIRNAILRELNRDGQVFFVHNRVSNIEGVANMVRRLVPEARVIVGHGQMHERDLARAMEEFVAHRADVLVATTIIENGLDIPAVNTIFIHEADRFGLADLHQLRGRVGRYKHRAYCYLILPAGRPVTESAAKRLRAIEEFTELGAGFKIAMRDLEIRGAGNILGTEQSGHIASVGYDLYCRLLEQAIREMKGEPAPPEVTCRIDIGVDAYIPDAYIRDDRQKLTIYRRLARVRSAADLEALVGELTDIFGPIPERMQTLIDQAEARLLAAWRKVTLVTVHGNDLIFRTDDADGLKKLLASAKLPVRQADERTVHLRLWPGGTQDPPQVLNFLRELLRSGRVTPAPQKTGAR